MQENPDENLLVAVGDALPILARALGPDSYAPIFAQYHADVLLKWTRSSQPDAIRAAGVGELPLFSRVAVFIRAVFELFYEPACHAF